MVHKMATRSVMKLLSKSVDNIKFNSPALRILFETNSRQLHILKTSQLMTYHKFSQCKVLCRNYMDFKIKDSFVSKSKPFELVISRCVSSSSLAERNCWKCGSNTNSKAELFFCNCGVVQSVPNDLDFFQVMNCNEEFDVNVEEMSRLHKALQRQLHPDKYSQKSQEEQSLAADQSSYINKAYFTLLKPLSRGLYLLELKGDPLEEKNSTVDPSFLMEVMEVNEDLSEASGRDAVHRIEMENRVKMDACLEAVSQAFAKNDVPAAKAALIKLKYFTNIDDKVKEIYRQEMS